MKPEVFPEDLYFPRDDTDRTETVGTECRIYISWRTKLKLKIYITM